MQQIECSPPGSTTLTPDNVAYVQQAFTRFLVLVINLLPLVLCGLMGLGVWLIFRPALMNNDSSSQYQQALSGEYRDWHPPILAIVLRGVIKCGGTIGQVTLIQCLAGCFGLYALVVRCLSVLYRKALAKRLRPWLALLVIAALLCPLSPLVFFLTGFVKDSWAMVLLLWIVVLLWGLYERRPVRRRWGWVALLIVVILLMVFFTLVRYNGVLLLPISALCLFAIMRRSACCLAWICLAIAAPFVLSFSASWAIPRIFKVQATHPGNQVMALDLVGLCVLDEKLRQDLPFTSNHLVEEQYRGHYIWGDVGPLYWTQPLIVTSGYAGVADGGGAADAALKKEYLLAVRKHVPELARVKWKSFVKLLGLKPVVTWVPVALGVYESNGLALNTHHEHLRQDLYDAAMFVHRSRLFRWVGAVHLVWIIANLVWILGAWVAFAVHRSGRCLFVALLLALPLGYYGSYLLATTAHDYRMMYPATLIVQALCLAALFGGLAALNRSSGNAVPAQ